MVVRARVQAKVYEYGYMCIYMCIYIYIYVCVCVCVIIPLSHHIILEFLFYVNSKPSTGSFSEGGVAPPSLDLFLSYRLGETLTTNSVKRRLPTTVHPKTIRAKLTLAPPEEEEEDGFNVVLVCCCVPCLENDNDVDAVGNKLGDDVVVTPRMVGHTVGLPVIENSVVTDTVGRIVGGPC